MLGLRTGLRTSLKTGLAAGLAADQLGGASMANVTKDATSGIYCPATAAEWATTLAVAGIGSGGPSFLWLCQEASGNLADAIGGITLTVTGAPGYQQTVAGWTRKAVTFTDGATLGFLSTNTSLPDIATTSFLLLAYTLSVSAPAALRTMFGMGTTTANGAMNTNQTPETRSNTNVANGSTAITALVPYAVKVDRTASSVVGYTLADKMNPTFTGTMTGKKVFLGPAAAASNSPPSATAYFAGLVGAAAELTDAQMKKLYQTLGWSPTWN